MAVTRSSSGSVEIRNVLPVLWMTLRLAVIGRMAMRYHTALQRYDTGAESDVLLVSEI